MIMEMGLLNMGIMRYKALWIGCIRGLNHRLVLLCGLVGMLVGCHSAAE